MNIAPSTVDGMILFGPGSDQFQPAVTSLYGREPDDTLRPALGFSVVAKNCTARAIALLGIRFDMITARGRPSAVIHYADTLRNPEQSALPPGTMRLVCVETAYTDLVLRRAAEVGLRERMNLDNLRKLISITASIDCIAFDDGQFAGPDSLAGFDRFTSEREAEIAFINAILQPDSRVDNLLTNGLEDRSTKTLSRRLQAAFNAGGRDSLLAYAHQYRPRIKLWR